MPALFWQLQFLQFPHRLFPCSCQQTKFRLFQVQVQVLPWVLLYPWDPLFQSIRWVQMDQSHLLVRLFPSVQWFLSEWMEILWVRWGLWFPWDLSRWVQ